VFLDSADPVTGQYVHRILVLVWSIHIDKEFLRLAWWGLRLFRGARAVRAEIYQDREV
jgi:hypothetical protein